MNRCFVGRLSWSGLFLFLICFSCGDDPIPIVSTPPLIFTVATASSVGGTITATQTIASGQTVTITATPDAHYQFEGWSGDCPISSTELRLTWEVTSHCLLIAEFEKISYRIEATATPGGSLTGLSGDAYAQGRAIILTAVPEANYEFIRWMLTSSDADGCPDSESLTSPTLRWVVQGPCQLEALFGTISRTITTWIGEGGTITETQMVAHGQEVTIAITLDEGYELHQWTGDCGDFSKEDTSLRFEATQDCQLKAVLQKKPYTITAEASAGGTIHGLPTRPPTHGQTMILTAEAAANHVFSRWTTEGVACPELVDAMDSKLSFTVEGPCALEAVFRKADRTITTSVSTGGSITPTQTVAHGEDVSITITIEKGYALKAWMGDCGTFSPDDTTIDFQVTRDCQVRAVLEKEAATEPVNPDPVDPESTNPDPVDPEPTNPDPVDPEPTNPDPVDPEPTNPDPVDPEPTDPDPVDPEPTDPDPVDPEPTDPDPVDPEPTNPVNPNPPPPVNRTITTSVTTGGSITNTQTVPNGQTVSITVTLNQGYTLERWTGSCGTFSNQQTTITFIASQDCQVQAVLAASPPPPPVNRIITTSVSTGGSITNTQTVPNGQTVSITVTLNQGYTLERWTGTCGTFRSSETTITFPASRDCQVNAVLAASPPPPPTTKNCNGQQISINDPCPPPPVNRTITTSVSTGGSITPTQSIPNGQMVSIAVTLEEGYTLERWTGNCGNFSHEQTTITFRATQDCQVHAVLAEEETTNPTPTTQNCHGVAISINETCPPLLKKLPNGVTVILNPALRHPSQYVGQQAMLDGITYTVVDNTLLRQRVSEGNTDAVCTTLVTDLQGLFTDDDFFNTYIGDWDTRRVTSMASLFKNARSFDQDISHWDVSGVTDMSAMFQNARLFNEAIGDWDVSGVTTMISTFKGARAFNQDLSGWDVSAVTNMVTLFQQATAFNQDISGWDVSAVTNLSATFEGATSFNQDISGWDVSGVTHLVGTFNGATAFNQDLSGWDVRGVTEMSWLFSGATAFDQDLSGWDVTKVSHCQQVACGLRADRRPGFTCNQECLLTRHANGVTVTLHPRIRSHAMQNPSTYVGQKEILDGIEYTIVDNALLTQQVGADNTDAKCTTLVTVMNQLFNGKTTFNEAIGDWDTSRVTTMGAMFFNASAFNQAIGDWDVSRVTDMMSMFNNASAFNQPIGDWDVSRVTNMASMFNNASAFNQPIGDWDVNRVTNMANMFLNADAFNQPMGDWDVGQVTSMQNMFDNASAFNQAIGDWDVSRVHNMYRMFQGATTFNQDLSGWDVSRVTNCNLFWANAGLTSSNRPTFSQCTP